MEFDYEIGRLRNTFGDKSYPDERVLLLWKEVASLEAKWFQKTVDKLIMYSKTPPLMTEFGPEIALERARMAKEMLRKEQEDRTSQGDEISEEEQKFYFKTIMQRMHGGVPDEEWECFKKLLKPR